MRVNPNLKPGLSGVLRVKNEVQFLSGCIDSCIDSLDELVIVYNDCTDGSLSVIKHYSSLFPEKISVYEYPYNVLGNNLSDEEYLYTKNLPDDDPRLLCNYYNFALSKVHFSYAIKIDADQLYISDILGKYRDVCKLSYGIHWRPSFIKGWLLMVALSLYRRLSQRSKMPLLSVLPASIIRLFKEDYRSYAKWRLSRGTAAISFSGLNVLCKDEPYVCMGGVHEQTIVLPPFNGEGDHLLFPVSSNTYYERFEMSYYNDIKGGKSIIEQFVHPYRVFYCDFMWFHLSPMRKSLSSAMDLMMARSRDCFEPLGNFTRMKYEEILTKADNRIFTLYQRILFYFIHTIAIDSIESNESLINDYHERG